MLRSITHIALVLLLLVSTSGMSISMHYCCGEYVSTSINKEAKSCCGETGGCCENKSMHFDVEDDYVNPVVILNNEISELDVLFPILFVLSSKIFDEVELNTIFYYDSSPPPSVQTRLSLLQTYLC